MVRNIVHWLALGFAMLLMLLVMLSAFQPAYAQSADAIIPPYSFWGDVWMIVQPIVVLLVSTVGPVLVAWISARLIALLKVTDEKQRLEIERQLRDALHQSAANALKFALSRTGLAVSLTRTISEEMIADAMVYVRDKNPEAVARLGVDGTQLRDIVLSKIPDLVAQGRPSTVVLNSPGQAKEVPAARS